MQLIVFFLYYSRSFHRVCNCTKEFLLYFVLVKSMHLHRGWLSFAWFDGRIPARPDISVSPFPFLKSFFYTSQPRMRFGFWLYFVLFCYFQFHFFSRHIFDLRRLAIKSASLLPPAFSKKNKIIIIDTISIWPWHTVRITTWCFSFII